MGIQRFQHSIRFSKEEWDAVLKAAHRNNLTPAEFVRAACARAVSSNLGLDNADLTPELAELIKRTFRGVHLLAYLRREELDGSDREDLFDRAVEAARIAQSETLGTKESTKWS